MTISIKITDLINQLDNLPIGDFQAADVIKNTTEVIVKRENLAGNYLTQLMFLSFRPTGYRSDIDSLLLTKEDWQSAKQELLTILKSILSEILLYDHETGEDSKTDRKSLMSNRIFIVHGHDEAMKQVVARLVEKLGLETIVLHEQSNKGRTIIEKFEDYADVGFAIVLLSGDDRGYLKSESPKTAKVRARQNVIFEMGYFIGKLGRERVLLLLEQGVEKPSDIDGIVYTHYDGVDGGWRNKMIQELKACGYDVDANKLY